MVGDKWWFGPIVFAALLLLLSWSFLFFPKWIHEPDWIMHERERHLRKLDKLLSWQKQRGKHRRNQKKKSKSRRSQTLASPNVISQFPFTGMDNAVHSDIRSGTSQGESVCHTSEPCASGYEAADMCSGVLIRDEAFSMPVSDSENDESTVAKCANYPEDKRITSIPKGVERLSLSNIATCEGTEKRSVERCDMTNFACRKEANASFSSPSEPSLLDRKISGQFTSFWLM